MTSISPGKATGESYTITIECTGGSGNSPTRGIAVTVPHGQGNGDGKKVHPLDSIVAPISLKGPLATPKVRSRLKAALMRARWVNA